MQYVTRHFHNLSYISSLYNMIFPGSPYNNLTLTKYYASREQITTSSSSELSRKLYSASQKKSFNSECKFLNKILRNC